MEWLKSIYNLILQLFKVNKKVCKPNKYSKRNLTDIEDKFYGRNS